MTREEAIKALRLERGIEINGNAVRVAEFLQGLDVALTALRPVSREQVEKAWRGDWIDCSNGWMCSRCEYDNTYAKPFCPSCGAAMTDEAVEMVVERMEALKDG